MSTSSNDTGAFTVTATDGETVLTDNDYSYSGGILTIKFTTPMTIKNTNTGSTTDRIVIGSESLQQGDTVSLTLAGVNIDRSSITTTEPAALTIADNAAFNVNIFLKDGTENILKGAAGYRTWDTDTTGSSGIQKNGDTSVGMLTITGGAGEKAGKLTATGGVYTAGIGGGGRYGSTSNITISGGKITANTGVRGAGIGGGDHGRGNNITISGGAVTATGFDGGAGIGGGDSSIGSTGNSIDGDNVVVIAESGDAAKDALDGFDAGINKGLIFTKKGSSGSWNIEMYSSSVDVTADVTIPADLEVKAGKVLTVDSGATFAVPDGITLDTSDDGQITVASGGTLQNDGIIDDNANISGTGNITTRTHFYLTDGSAYGTDDYYQTYMTGGNVQKYSNLPNPDTPLLYRTNVTADKFAYWYYLDTSGNKVPINNTVDVLPNQHLFYEERETAYTITISSSENGTVTSDKAEAIKDETVTLTVSSEEGYRLQAGTLKVAAGSTELSLTDKGDGTYTFTMPASNVAVSATFEPIPYYSVTIETLNNGRIISDKTQAKQADIVTLTVTPDEGYQLQEDSLKVVAGSTEVALTDKGDGTYTFSMPEANVAVSATFEPVPGPGPVPGDTVTLSFKTDEGSWNGITETTLTGAPDAVIIPPSYPYVDAARTCIGWFDEQGKEIVSGQTKFQDVTGVVTARFVDSPGWHQNNTGWWYVYDLNNNYYTNCWALINSAWFYFNESGYCLEYTWGYINGSWYLFGWGGYMQTGWQWLGGSWYFLDRYTGAMKCGWVHDGVWYYCDAELGGAMYDNCWAYIGGNWYGFNEGGSMTQGWSYSYAYDGWFYLQPDTGHMLYSWQYIGGHWYYFYDNGLMAANTYVGNYWLGSDGAWS